MEQFSQAYAFLWDVCGPWGIALLAGVVLLFLIQCGYWAGYYGRIPSYRNATSDGSRPAVSVALVVREADDAFLEETLPLLLAQEYDRYEIVITELTGDVEFGETLAMIAEHTPRLNVTRMVRDPRFPISDKMALNVAIKAARYDNILLTTADCRPASNQWVGRMARGFEHADLVIGYCGMEGGNRFSDRMIRLGRVGHAARWIGAAMHGHPYRGMIQNLGLTKAIYFANHGFNHLNMNIGMDDLFVQKLAAGARTATIVSANSLVRQKIWGGLRWWYADRRLQSNTFRFYPAGVRLRIGLELWSRALFLPAVVAAIVLLPAELKLFAAALWLLRLLLVLFEMRRIALRLCERGVMRVAPLYDLCSPYYEGWMALSRTFKRSPGVWR